MLQDRVLLEIRDLLLRFQILGKAHTLQNSAAVIVKFRRPGLQALIQADIIPGKSGKEDGTLAQEKVSSTK